MKINDEKLSEFFYDLKNILDYKCNMPGLEKFYEECLNILDTKTYSDINIQDEKGNTYLHYLSKNCQWDWFIKLLNHGGDITIKNKEGYCVLRMAPGVDGVVNLLKKPEMKDLGSFATIKTSWSDKTKKYNKNTKQFFLNYFLRDNMFEFENIEKALNFLKENKLNNSNNKIMLVAFSEKIDSEDRMSWFKNNYPNANAIQNSKFIEFYIKESTLVTPRKTKIINLFLKEKIKIKQTSGLHYTIIETLKVNNGKDKEYSNLIRNLIKLMLENKYDFDKEDWSRNKKTSILEEIERNPENYAIFLDEKLKENKSKIKVKPNKI